jgi:hypothetical protein
MSDGWQHIEITDHGTIVVLRPFTDEAIEWFEANVGDSGPGGIYTCEPRQAQDILRGAAQALLTWQ